MPDLGWRRSSLLSHTRLVDLWHDWQSGRRNTRRRSSRTRCHTAGKCPNDDPCDQDPQRARSNSCACPPSLALARPVLEPAPLGAETEGDPKQVVERDRYAPLIEVMQKADELGYAGRYATLRAGPRQHAFDYGFMARVSAGKYWRDLNDVPKKPSWSTRSADLARRRSRPASTATAARSFEVVGEEERPRNTVLVLNNLTTERWRGDPDQLPACARPKWRLARYRCLSGRQVQRACGQALGVHLGYLARGLSRS